MKIDISSRPCVKVGILKQYDKTESRVSYVMLPEPTRKLSIKLTGCLLSFLRKTQLYFSNIQFQEHRIASRGETLTLIRTRIP